MGKYANSNLTKGETIISEAKITVLFLIKKWIIGILFCWLLLIPTIKAVISTIKFFNIELVVTNKRIVGKVGVINSGALDAPLNKIQNVSTSSGLFGKIFRYGNIVIQTAAGEFRFYGVKHPESFKGIIMNQIDQYEEDKIKQQATEMAQAMANVINK